MEQSFWRTTVISTYARRNSRFNHFVRSNFSSPAASFFLSQFLVLRHQILSQQLQNTLTEMAFVKPHILILFPFHERPIFCEDFWQFLCKNFHRYTAKCRRNIFGYP